MKLGRQHLFALCCLSSICPHLIACQAAASEGNTSDAVIATASPQEAPAQQDATAQASELSLLSLLGWQDAFDPDGYSIKAELPANCTSTTWQALGLLHSLVNLTLTSNLPDLPSSWGHDNSFTALQSMTLVSANLTGTLPDSWAERTAFPCLRQLRLAQTNISGQILMLLC